MTDSGIAPGERLTGRLTERSTEHSTEHSTERSTERLTTSADEVRVALSPLGGLADAPVSGHVGVFEQVLAGLETVLASVEEPGGRPEARGTQESAVSGRIR